jgi:hypothetical protein
MAYLDKTKTYYVGEPITYGSIYGYQKRRFPIYQTGQLASTSSPVGSVKEEKIIGVNGDTVGVMFYERNGWKKHGQQRFYHSIHALLEAVGGKLVDASVAAPLSPETGQAWSAPNFTTGSQPLEGPTLEQRVKALEDLISVQSHKLPDALTETLKPRVKKRKDTTKKAVAKGLALAAGISTTRRKVKASEPTTTVKRPRKTKA